MAYHLIVTAGGVIALVVLWILVQNAARRHLPRIPTDGDALACGSCQADGICLCGLRQTFSEVDGGARSGEPRREVRP